MFCRNLHADLTTICLQSQVNIFEKASAQHIANKNMQGYNKFLPTSQKLSLSIYYSEDGGLNLYISYGCIPCTNKQYNMYIKVFPTHLYFKFGLQLTFFIVLYFLPFLAHEQTCHKLKEQITRYFGSLFNLNYSLLNVN